MCAGPVGTEFVAITKTNEALPGGAVTVLDRSELTRVCPDCHQANPDWPLAWLSIAGMAIGRVPDSLTALCHECGEIVDREQPHTGVWLLHVCQNGDYLDVVQSGLLAVTCLACRDASMKPQPH
jgi:hypothetical protein